MIKRILLVNSNTESSPYPVAPVGLCMLATAAKEAGYKTKVFDGFWNREKPITEDYTRSLLNTIIDFRPDLIGVSIRNIDDIVMQQPIFYIEEIERVCIEPIRKYGKAITVLGGAGFSLFPVELLERWQFDYGIVGPGEQSFLSLLNALNRNMTAKNIPRLLVRKPLIQNNGDKYSMKKQVKTRSGISNLKIPHSDIDKHLFYGAYQNRGSYPIQTKRGCTLKCLYCSYPTIEGKTYQLRTVEDIVDEIGSVVKRLEQVTFEFVDSTFNHPLDHAEAICKEIIQRGLKLRLRTMGMNPAWITPKLINLMKKAGFAQVDCTPDSASDTMLVNLRKGFNRKKLEHIAKILKDADMPTMWFFVLGGPGENIRTLDETFDFIHQFIDEKDLVHITEGLRIYPGTGLADHAIREGGLSREKSLLKPRFYVSPGITPDLLEAKVQGFVKSHYNCVRSVDSTPSKEMIGKAMEIRKHQGLTNEPMFRTLLRLRKEEMMKN